MKFLKLLKYEYLEYLSTILIINGFLFVLLFIARLLINYAHTFFVKIFLVFLLPCGLIFSFVFLLIAMIKSLHSRLFTTQGYLTLSLPVSIDSILLSKIIVSSSWCIISIIMLSFWILLMHISFNVLIPFKDFFLFIKEQEGLLVILGTVCFYAIGVIVSIVSFVIIVLLVLSVINVCRIVKFRSLVGIVLFIIFSIFYTYLLYYETLFASEIFTNIYSTIERNKFLLLVDLLVIIHFSISIVTSALFYFIARYLIKNKIEI